jgi:hypothetical protein
MLALGSIRIAANNNALPFARGVHLCIVQRSDGTTKGLPGRTHQLAEVLRIVLWSGSF